MIRYRRNDVTDTPAPKVSLKAPAIKPPVIELTTETATLETPGHPLATLLPEPEVLDLMATTGSFPKRSKPAKRSKVRGRLKVSDTDRTLPLLADIES